jgi:hypothetical protein
MVPEPKTLPTHPVASLSDLFSRRASGPIAGLPVDELIAALRVVESMTDRLDKRVMNCGVTDSGMIWVRTGEWPGPTAGGGAYLLLRKTDGGWVVVETGGWC